MTSLLRAARIIVCKSCRATAYSTARSALALHDETRHLDPIMSEAAPIHSQQIARMTLVPSSRRDTARSPAAITITKSP
jgi:hypothetical protein